jgi:hypothetical protein
MTPEFNISENAQKVFLSHENVMILHAHALACHCECLGMNAENSLAVCRNETPPYSTNEYFLIMLKWGLVSDDGKVII